VKIGIIGSGKMGAGLGKLWSAKGHKVYYTDLTSAKSEAAALSTRRNALHGSISEAAEFASVLLLAVPYFSVYKALEGLITSGKMRNKILIDCTNPLSNDLRSLVVGNGISAAEKISSAIPKGMNVKVVKAFNTIGSHILESGRTRFGRDRAAVFYCGNNRKAKAVVARLIQDIGFVPVDSGALDSARFLEPLAVLIIRISQAQNSASDIAFKLLKR